ncbi:MAG: hypothetical protein CVV32_07275 [Methanomicrobiales archaeon HGW-Methanomicrobiales-3]|jgi:hypothetical protein|nr:MAG: hypothetical protein CVV32_07275 [Methanomicrobiales archaeon HGW-Methanomicrobiales-3]
MSADLLSILIVLTVGMFFGTIIGLLIGYLAHQQAPDWQSMSGRQRLINALLILGCSALCIAGIAWYAFR